MDGNRVDFVEAVMGANLLQTLGGNEASGCSHVTLMRDMELTLLLFKPPTILVWSSPLMLQGHYLMLNHLKDTTEYSKQHLEMLRLRYKRNIVMTVYCHNDDLSNLQVLLQGIGLDYLDGHAAVGMQEKAGE